MIFAEQYCVDNNTDLILIVRNHNIFCNFRKYIKTYFGITSELIYMTSHTGSDREKNTDETSDRASRMRH